MVFSFDPRCHGLRGSQKDTSSPRSAANRSADTAMPVQMSTHRGRIGAERSRDQTARLTALPPLPQIVLLLVRERHTHFRIIPSRTVRSPIETANVSGVSKPL